MIRAAGILFRVKGDDGAVLFLRRGSGGDHAGEWCLPGGSVEDGETPEEAAARESREEAGPGVPDGKRKILSRRVARSAPVDVPGSEVPTLAVRDEDVDFTTFLQEVDAPFDVEINDESTAYAWAPADSPPEPLHPGARVSLAMLTANELDVARMMAAGDLTSPQLFGNVALFDIRITGTGVAYRKAHDEYCYRAPENYLTPEFLARCNGLPVLWEHPAKATLDSKEWADRVVGTTFLPYLRGDEVWGIVKIYDETAVAELTKGGLSTSPTVDFGAGVVVRDVNVAVTLEDGSKLLMEGEPPLLDHIAICSKGVWDKGGEPSGVNTARADRDMADEDDKKREDAAKADQAKADQAKADAARADAEEKRWTALMDSVAGLGKRMDSMEEDRKSDKARRDAEEEVKKANEAKDEPGAGDDKEVERKGEKMADKKKDADEDDKDKKSDKKKDADEDEKKREDAAKADAARADSDRKLLDRALAEIADLKRATHRSDEDFNALGAAQARADAVCQLWGKQASRPYAGETTLGYRRRMATELKAHSKDWKDTDISKIGDAGTFDVIEAKIYADAVTSARSPLGVPTGQLRELRRMDDTGTRVIKEYVGDPASWMAQFSSPPQQLAGVRNTN